MDMGWNKDNVYDRGRASMRGVVGKDTSCLRENRSEMAVSWRDRGREEQYTSTLMLKFPEDQAGEDIR